MAKVEYSTENIPKDEEDEESDKVTFWEFLFAFIFLFIVMLPVMGAIA